MTLQQITAILLILAFLAMPVQAMVMGDDSAGTSVGDKTYTTGGMDTVRDVLCDHGIDGRRVVDIADGILRDHGVASVAVRSVRSVDNASNVSPADWLAVYTCMGFGALFIAVGGTAIIMEILSKAPMNPYTLIYAVVLSYGISFMVISIMDYQEKTKE
jgi:hypothetical protein